MRLTTNGKRIFLQTAYNPEYPDLIKSIAGARWVPSRGLWSMPMSLSSLRLVRTTFGKVKMSSELHEWTKQELSRERVLRDLGKQHDAVLTHVPHRYPHLANAMASRTYQRSGARFVAESGGRCLLADEPGLGKTATSLAGLVELEAIDGQHLVLATGSALESVWKRQVSIWIPDANVVVLPEGAAARRKAIAMFEELDEPKFLVVNQASIRRSYGLWCATCEIWEEDYSKDTSKLPENHYLQEHKAKRRVRKDALPEVVDQTWTSVILDESHKVLAGWKSSNKTQQGTALFDISSKNRIALTGTPLRGREENLWGTLEWLGESTGGYWSWINSYFEMSEGYFGKTILGIDAGRSSSFHKRLDGIVLRRTRSEVRPDLPLGQRNHVVMSMTAEHERQYREFEAMGEVALKSGMIEGLGLLSELTRLRQMSYGVWDMQDGKLRPTNKSPKVQFVLDWLGERGVTGKKSTEWRGAPGEAFKFVIASGFTEIINSVERELERLGIETYKIIGDTKQQDRAEFQRRFQSEQDPVRVMLLNTFTGGESIELDAWSDEMIILDSTYVADDQVQLEGRINNRGNRVSPRTWWYLITEGTIEERIHAMGEAQHDLQHRLLDRRRGVEVALHLMGGEQ